MYKDYFSNGQKKLNSYEIGAFDCRETQINLRSWVSLSFQVVVVNPTLDVWDDRKSQFRTARSITHHYQINFKIEMKTQFT